MFGVVYVTTDLTQEEGANCVLLALFPLRPDLVPVSKTLYLLPLLYCLVAFLKNMA